MMREIGSSVCRVPAVPPRFGDFTNSCSRSCPAAAWARPPPVCGSADRCPLGAAVLSSDLSSWPQADSASRWRLTTTPSHFVMGRRRFQSKRRHPACSQPEQHPAVRTKPGLADDWAPVGDTRRRRPRECHQVEGVPAHAVRRHVVQSMPVAPTAVRIQSFPGSRPGGFDHAATAPPRAPQVAGGAPSRATTHARPQVWSGDHATVSIQARVGSRGGAVNPCDCCQCSSPAARCRLPRWCRATSSPSGRAKAIGRVRPGRPAHRGGQPPRRRPAGCPR